MAGPSYRKIPGEARRFELCEDSDSPSEEGRSSP
jgi:hypothetical protein